MHEVMRGITRKNKNNYETFQKKNTCHNRCHNPNLAKCGGEAQHLEKLGIWSPLGLPNV